MSDETNNVDDLADNERWLANVIKLAGRRADIPVGIESRVRHRVQEEWRASTALSSGNKAYARVHQIWRRGALQKSVLRWLPPMGVAASAVIAVMVVSQPEPAPLTFAATVSRVIGSGSALAQFPLGSAVHAGDTIVTGPGEGISLLLARSESLRIDANTRLRIDAKDRFTLFHGRVYADTGQFVYRDGGLRIDTNYGSVTDVGTQFSVTTDDMSLDVAVREGRVDIASESDALVALMGQRLTLVAGQGASVVEITPHDDYWKWVAELAPEFDMTHRSLLDFLKWAARETGRELYFETDASRMSAMRTDVHGAVSGMSPQQVLQAVLATTTANYRLERGKIIVEAR
jgi:ferric-dicitrate binding protein FerR (iron transport regulator)